MKGKKHVLSEVNLMMICYNLTRMLSIFGVKALKNRLKSLTSILLNEIVGILVDLSYFFVKNLKQYFSIFNNKTALNGLYLSLLKIK